MASVTRPNLTSSFVVLTLLSALSAGLSGCASRPPPRAPIPRATPSEALRAGDLIQIKVEGEEGATFRLAPDGGFEPRGCEHVVADGKPTRARSPRPLHGAAGSHPPPRAIAK